MPWNLRLSRVERNWSRLEIHAQIQFLEYKPRCRGSSHMNRILLPISSSTTVFYQQSCSDLFHVEWCQSIFTLDNKFKHLRLLDERSWGSVITSGDGMAKPKIDMKTRNRIILTIRSDRIVTVSTAVKADIRICGNLYCGTHWTPP
jgi:hypothetical protein